MTTVQDHRVRCHLNACREEVWFSEYDAHHAEKHMDHDELVSYASDYFLLRDVVINRLNPRDDDASEVSVLMCWIEHVANTLEAMPCTCTPAMVEDNSACPRCDALGKLGDQVQSR